MLNKKNYEVPKSLEKEQEFYEEIRKRQKEENWLPISKEVSLRLNKDGEDVVFQAGKEESKKGEVAVRFLLDKDTKEWSDWIGTGETALGFDMMNITKKGEKEAKRILGEVGGFEHLKKRAKEEVEEKTAKKPETE